MDFSKKEFETFVGCAVNVFPKNGLLILVTQGKKGNLWEQSDKEEGSPFEWFQLFDQCDEPIVIDGLFAITYRNECHKDGRIRNVYHRGVSAFVLRNGHELLVSTRSASKDLYPGMCEPSVSEHNQVRERSLDALDRGFAEELGTICHFDQLELLFKVKIEDVQQSEWATFYVYHMRPEQEYHISNESSSLDWIDMRELQSGNPARHLNMRSDLEHPFNLFVLWWLNSPHNPKKNTA